MPKTVGTGYNNVCVLIFFVIVVSLTLNDVFLLDNHRETISKTRTIYALDIAGKLTVMTAELLNVVKGLRMTDGGDQDQSVPIDEMLKKSQSKKRPRKAPGALKKELEDSFLNPPTSFSPEWLNKLQQYVA